MEQSYPTGEQEVRNAEVTLRLNPDALVPAAEELAYWRQRLTEQPEEQRIGYCLGALMFTVAATVKAVGRSDPEGIAYHLRNGLAATALYEQLAAERRARWEQGRG